MKRFLRFWLMLCAVADKMYDNFFTFSYPVSIIYLPTFVNIMTLLYILSKVYKLFDANVFFTILAILGVLTIYLASITDREMTINRSKWLKECRNYKLWKIIIIVYAVLSILNNYILLLII